MISKTLSLAVVALAVPVATHAAAPVWALNYNQGINLVSVPLNIEAPFLPSPVVSDSLAADLAGVLYVADSAGTIYSVQGGIPLGSAGAGQIADLYFAAGGLWGFSNANSTLFFFDLGSAAVTYSLPITAGLGGNTITGVARHPSTGDIFLSGYTAYNQDSLLLLDLNTATASLVGSLAHADTASYISDIEFDTLGNLLAMTWYHRDFYQVNPANAATSLISNGPHRDVTGLAVLRTEVPEAGTWAAAIVMPLAIWSLSRRVGAKPR